MLWIFIIISAWSFQAPFILRIIYWFLVHCSSIKWHFEAELVFSEQWSNLHTQNSRLSNSRKLGVINTFVQCVSLYVVHSNITSQSLNLFTLRQHKTSCKIYDQTNICVKSKMELLVEFARFLIFLAKLVALKALPLHISLCIAWESSVRGLLSLSESRLKINGDWNLLGCRSCLREPGELHRWLFICSKYFSSCPFYREIILLHIYTKLFTREWKWISTNILVNMHVCAMTEQLPSFICLSVLLEKVVVVIFVFLFQSK